MSIQSVPGSNADARVKKVTKLEPNNSDHLSALCGPFDKNLRQIESRLDVKIKNRGHEFEILGDQKTVVACLELLKQLYREVINGGELSPDASFISAGVRYRGDYRGPRPVRSTDQDPKEID